ncbi:MULTISPECIES: PadR family transcriptional regulator [unclassified Crossiella]|uniref:PadR family transcriptional regulator n=1 Tax=unclassified Crossiella TaxID=2620835 RepID=UPI00200026BB|nr:MULTISPECIES: PadR family transcriptional regulator [unclassified Crossiella]MCK2238891.1 PadR family transcriptional regulator [Crossiella sp. S99.2]MCK2251539.1 PadR family transcriptional regulator [Crossiella sp. S99.1]
MSATRLLLLGVVRWCGTAHGYLVRAELESWWAHEWANIKWGSIYHGLKQLTKQELMTAASPATNVGRVDYALTEAGDAEFLRLLRATLREPEQHKPDLLAAALVLMPTLPRDEVISLLKERLAALEVNRAQVAGQAGDLTEPAHMSELFGVWRRSADSSIAWTQDLVERIEAGEHTFAGEAPHVFGMPGGATFNSDGTPRPRPRPDISCG